VNAIVMGKERPSRPRQSVCRRDVSAAARGPGYGVFHEPTGQLLGQCGGGEFLCHTEKRTGLLASVSDPAGSEDRDL